MWILTGRKVDQINEEMYEKTVRLIGAGMLDGLK